MFSAINPHRILFQRAPCSGRKHRGFEFLCVALLTGGNGLDIPYIGYIELKVCLFGQELADMGFLILRDLRGTPMQERKSEVPGLIGCNILKHL